jgi:long-subunit acyl-CoA synthetase (AMP-forming)
MGMMHHGLLPEVEGEGRSWRFLGIQAKNRKEWNLLHVANMCVGATTVALYDTLGV